MAKKTKREYFAEIREFVADNEELVAFIDHEVELLNKKSGANRKPTKTQIENEGFKADILEVLAREDRPLNISELQEACPSIAELKNQRVTHLLTALIADGRVVRTEVKRKPYFAIAVGGDEEGGEGDE